MDCLKVNVENFLKSRVKRKKMKKDKKIRKPVQDS